jgi:hypothetical protein
MAVRQRAANTAGGNVVQPQPSYGVQGVLGTAVAYPLENPADGPTRKDRPTEAALWLFLGNNSLAGAFCLQRAIRKSLTQRRQGAKVFLRGMPRNLFAE